MPVSNEKLLAALSACFTEPESPALADTHQQSSGRAHRRLLAINRIVTALMAEANAPTTEYDFNLPPSPWWRNNEWEIGTPHGTFQIAWVATRDVVAMQNVVPAVVALPDLLCAAQWVLARAEQRGDDRDDDGEVSEEFAALKAALKKASEGQL